MKLLRSNSPLPVNSVRGNRFPSSSRGCCPCEILQFLRWTLGYNHLALANQIEQNGHWRSRKGPSQIRRRRKRPPGLTALYCHIANVKNASIFGGDVLADRRLFGWLPCGRVKRHSTVTTSWNMSFKKCIKHWQWMWQILVVTFGVRSDFSLVAVRGLVIICFTN